MKIEFKISLSFSSDGIFSIIIEYLPIYSSIVLFINYIYNILFTENIILGIKFFFFYT